MLIEILFALIGRDQVQLRWLIDDLDALVPFYKPDDNGLFLPQLRQLRLGLNCADNFYSGRNVCI